jgi:hypothetical protein
MLDVLLDAGWTKRVGCKKRLLYVSVVSRRWTATPELDWAELELGDRELSLRASGAFGAGDGTMSRAFLWGM